MSKKYTDLVEEKVQQAMKEGAFKDLSGKGKPLNFADFMGSTSENWTANKILKNANYLPPWLELDKEIRQHKEELEVILQNHLIWLKVQQELLLTDKSGERGVLLKKLEKTHQSVYQRYMELVMGLNPKIRKMNLNVPMALFQKNVIDEAEWIEKFDLCNRLYLEIISQPSTEKKEADYKNIWGKIGHLMTKIFKKGGCS